MSWLYGKKKYIIHIQALKEALDHGVILETVNRVIEIRKYLALEPNYHATKCFSENLVAMEISKNKCQNGQVSMFRSNSGHEQDSYG